MQLIHERSGVAPPNQGRQALAAADLAKLLHLFERTDEDEAVIVPGIDQPRRCAVRRDQRTDEQIGIEDEAHRAAPRLTARGKTFGADLGQGFLDRFFDFRRWDVRVAGPSLLDRLSEHQLSSCFLDEFRQQGADHCIFGAVSRNR
jgi:hypothetical protein